MPVNNSIPIDLLRLALSKDKTLTISATGTSMIPTIYPGDNLKISRIDPRNIKPHHIILFRNENGFSIHRVHRVKKTESGRLEWLTKGDANKNYDPPVQENDLIAKVTKIESRLHKRTIPYLLQSAMLAYERVFLKILHFYRNSNRTKLYRFLHPLKLRIFGKNPCIGIFFDGINRLNSDHMYRYRHPLLIRNRIFKKHTLLNVRIEVLTENNHASFLELWNSTPHLPLLSSPNDIHTYSANRFRSDKVTVWGAFNKDQLEGFLLVSEDSAASVFSIEVISIRKESQNKGVATQLLWKLISLYKKVPKAQVFVCRHRLFFNGINTEQHPACIQLFLKNGFTINNRTSAMYFKLSPTSALSAVRNRSDDSIRYTVLKDGLSEALLKTAAKFSQKKECQFLLQQAGGSPEKNFILAINGSLVLGYIYFEKITRFNSVCGNHLVKSVQEKTGCADSAMFILSHLIVDQHARNLKIGTNLIRATLNHLSESANPDIIIFETSLPVSFFEEFNGKKVWNNLYFSGSNLLKI